MISTSFKDSVISGLTDLAWFAFEGKLTLLYNLVGPGTTMGWWTKYLMNRVGYSPAEELVVI